MFSEKPGIARPQRADTAHHHLDPHTGLRGPIERVDHLLVDQRVRLQPDSALGALAGGRDFAVDALDDAPAHAVRGDEQVAVGVLA